MNHTTEFNLVGIMQEIQGLHGMRGARTRAPRRSCTGLRDHEDHLRRLSLGRGRAEDRGIDPGAIMAEREGFEPPIRLPVCRISSAVLSTTQPPLRGRKGANICLAAMYPTQDR